MKKFYTCLILLFWLQASVQTAYAQITPNIVGGEDTDIDEVPWQVLLEINGQEELFNPK